MDLSKVATDTAESMDTLVKFILSLDISPEDKKARIARAFRIIGTEFYTKLYGATSEILDSTAIKTLIDLDYNQIDRLANKLVQNYVLGREIDYLVKDYYDSELGRAQNEAFQNALSLNKHPTLERIVVGETCRWCIDKAGVHHYPSGEDFARHRDCDCMFIVSGYNTRNGILKNYVKESKQQSTGNMNFKYGEKIAEELQKNGDRIYNGLSSNEKKVLDRYTDGASAIFNMAQTGYKKMEYKKDVVDEKTLYRILSRSSLGENIIAYSGVSDPSSFDGLNAKINNLFTDRKYVSATLNKKTAKEFARFSDSDVEIYLEIHIPRKTQALYLGNNSWDKSSQELIIQKNSTYKVLARSERNGIIEMVLEIQDD